MNLRHWSLIVAAAFGLDGCSTCPPSPPPPALPAGPDLVADRVWTNPEVIHVGDGVIFNHSIHNVGASPAPGGSYDVDLFLDGAPLAADHDTVTLDPGKFTTYTCRGFHWTADKAGVHTYKLTVTPKAASCELSSGNNILEGEFTVQP